MDMFQIPILPDSSPLEESEEQFEAFCRKSGTCCLFFSVCGISLLYFSLTPPSTNLEIRSCWSRCEKATSFLIIY